MADPFVSALVNIRALEAVALKALSTLAVSPSLIVGTQGVGMATTIFIQALVDVLAGEAVPGVSLETETAVVSPGVLAAGLLVTLVQAVLTLIDILAMQPVAVVAHAANTGVVVVVLHAVGLGVAPPAHRLAELEVSDWKEQGVRENKEMGFGSDYVTIKS